MDYFVLRQDKRYTNPPAIRDLYRLLRRKDLCRKEAYKIPQRNVVFAPSSRNLDFLDVLDDQLFLVTEKVKKVITLYEPATEFKHFCILNNLKNEYGLYYAPILPEAACVSETKGIGVGRRMTFEMEKAGSHSFFRAVGTEREITVVRLDAAESLLRRGVRGITLERV